MKVIAKKNRELALINAQNTQNENRAETITLVVPEEYEDYNKKIVFITDDETVWDVITNNEYKITNAITKYKQVDFYIWLTKEVDGESIDFRTKTKTLNFYHNEDASDEITDEEIHGVNTVVNLLEEEIEKVENLNIEATKIGDTTTITITKKDGTTESVEINDGVDGKDGEDGKDAKINGKNSIEIEAGNNITIDNTETGIRINSTNDVGTTDYTDLENKPKINNVELSGNKSLNDLGIQPKGNYIEDNNYVHTDNNFNNTYKNKLEGLENYDDTEIKADISDIQDEQVEQNTDIEALQTENARLKATLPTTTGEGQDITLNKTAELEFVKPPLPMGNSEQVQYSGKNLFNAEENLTFSGVKTINVSIPAGTYRLTFESQSHQGEQNPYIRFDEANIGMDFDRTLDREIILNTDVSTVYLYSNGYNYVESQGISATINKLMVSVAGGDYEPYVRSELQAHHQTIHNLYPM